MDIKNLVPVDYANQRVLTIAQVAEVFNTAHSVIKENFRYSKKHFQEGADYFKVTGEALRALKFKLGDAHESGISRFVSPIPKTANAIILFTAQGCARHCKMLNTPQAWAIMDKLKAEYFATEGETKPALVPQVFNHPQFGNLRSVFIDGVIWFVGKDVAAALGYKDTFAALKQHVDDEDKLILNASALQQMASQSKTGKSPVWECDSPRGLIFINESGLYSLILRSNLPEAKKFNRWVTAEVLPSIRKHGFYSKKPVEEPVAHDEHVKLKPLIPVAVVYAVLFVNALVKIGYTNDFYRRLKELRKETKCDISQFLTTPFMPLDDARLLELALKAKFFDRLADGEFFLCNFEDVKAALVPHVDKAAALLDIAREMQPSPEKDKLLLQAAELL